MNVFQMPQRMLDVNDRISVVTMIVLVITHDIHHVGKVLGTCSKELHVTICLGRRKNTVRDSKIHCSADISRQD
jgi:hypothetical protein